MAYNRNRSRMISIQVKTLSNRIPGPLGDSLEKVTGDFWVIVNNVALSPQTYVLFPHEVKDLAHRGEKKDGRVSYWVQPSSCCVVKFHDRWDRIGEPG